MALSDRSGHFDLCIPDENNLGTAPLSRKWRDTSQPISVKVMTAHEFLEARRIRGEYVVKIDVEGHESNVGRGCLAYFRKHPPKAIIFESTGHKYEGRKFSDKEAYRMLLADKYRVFAVQKSLFRLKLTEVMDNDPHPNATDFVAVRSSLVGRLGHVS